MPSKDETEKSLLIPQNEIQLNGKCSINKVQQLKKSLGSFDVFMFVVGVIVGSGIYVSPGLVARYTSNMGTSLLLWTISGIVCLLGALCFCELAIALKKTGSWYLFIKEAYGDLAGFCSIWAQTLVLLPTGIAVVSVTISEHVVEMFADTSTNQGQWLVKAVAISTICVSFAINCISTSFTAKAQTFFSITQILGIAVFICIGIWNVSDGKIESYETMFTSDLNETTDFNSLSLAFVSALFSYDGWGETVALNEELHDINRNLRFGIMTGIPFVTICFLLFNLAFMSKLTHAEIGRSVTVATTFIQKSIGAKFAVIVPIFVAFSCCGNLNSVLMFGSRSTLSAAREGHLPLPFSYIHQQRCTPIPALMLLCAFSTLWVLCLGSQVINLLIYYSVAIWVTYGAALFAVIILRIRQPDLERPYKVWLIYPIITSLVSCYIIVALFVKRPVECSVCLCVLLSAVPVHYLVVYYIPDSVKSHIMRVYTWILDRFPLAQCLFETKPIGPVAVVEESQC